MLSSPRPFVECAIPAKPTAESKTRNMLHAPGLAGKLCGAAAAGAAATPAEAVASAAASEIVAIRCLLMISSFGRTERAAA